MGESGAFVQDGNTRLGGSLPINTDGGVCNIGRHHGGSHCVEAVRQLRGECGDRQVPGDLREVPLLVAVGGDALVHLEDVDVPPRHLGGREPVDEPLQVLVVRGEPGVIPGLGTVAKSVSEQR